MNEKNKWNNSVCEFYILTCELQVYVTGFYSHVDFFIYIRWYFIVVAY